MTLLELAKQYEADVETRISCIKNEDDMGIREMDSDEIAHWQATLEIIQKVIEENQK